MQAQMAAYASEQKQRSGSNNIGGGNSNGGIGSPSVSSSSSSCASSQRWLRAALQGGRGGGRSLPVEQLPPSFFLLSSGAKGADTDVDGQVRGPGEVGGHEHDGHLDGFRTTKGPIC